MSRRMLLMTGRACQRSPSSANHGCSAWASGTSSTASPGTSKNCGPAAACSPPPLTTSGRTSKRPIGLGGSHPSERAVSVKPT